MVFSSFVMSCIRHAEVTVLLVPVEFARTGDGHNHGEADFNWTGKQSFSTGVELKQTAAVGVEEGTSLRRMWRLCERAGL